MNCPLCDKELMVTDSPNMFVCPQNILLYRKYIPHYKLEQYDILEWTAHNMIIMPYKILTLLPHNRSIIYKYNDFGIFNNIFDTTELNIEPIKPMTESALRSRLKTIMVFS